jgi:hypothetical protein
MTVACCAKAAFYYVPSVLICKRTRIEDKTRDGAPSRSVFAFILKELHRQITVLVLGESFHCGRKGRNVLPILEHSFILRV